MGSHHTGLAFALGVFLLLPSPAGSQGLGWDPRSGLAVGTEEERYLRVLEVAGLTRGTHPWSLREFMPVEVASLLPPAGISHPWEGSRAFAADSTDDSGWGWIAPETGVLFNSAFPYGENDGPLWAGRGVTGAVAGGVWLRKGRLHVRVAPQAFWAQNRSFTLYPATPGAGDPFGDPLSGGNGDIDAPQRFGDTYYSRLDLESTSLTLEAGPLVLGGGSSPQWWGPAVRYPLVLGDNAGGFLHAFAQTARPVDLWLVRVHARMVAGRLDQSDWSPVREGELRRFAAAVALVLMPRGFDGLELGLTRFSEQTWPSDGVGLGDLLRPFAGAFSGGLGDDVNVSSENQVASAFFRWVFPRAGLEIYGELFKEDFSRDFRQVLTEPEDLSAFTVGLQRAWTASGGSVLALRVEAVTAETHHSERGDEFLAGRREPRPLPPYQHGAVLQGHTQNGQLLGSPAAYGGSGWTLGTDVYHPGGRWSLDFVRELRLDWLSTQTGDARADMADVIYTLRGEAVRFRGDREWHLTVAPSIEINRYLERGNDVFNLNVALSVRGLR